MLDTQHRALFKDAYAQLCRSARFTLDQIERVQMARTHVDQPACVLLAGDHFTDVCRINQARGMAVTELGQLRLLVLERGKLGGRVGQLAEAPAQVTVDGVLGNALAHQLDRVDPGLLQISHAVLTDIAGKTADIMADAANQLATVASARAPADAPGFEEDHRQTALGQFQRSIDPGQAATDHADVGAQLFLQRRVGRAAARRSGVVRGSVLAL